MRKSEMKKFRGIFEQDRAKILYNDRVIRDDFNVDTEDRSDEVDQATSETEQAMRMRLRNRERLYLRKVEEALFRISDGTFGECSECEQQIEKRRLEARPTATLCIACKEDEERKESLTSYGRQHKSLGDTFSRAYASV